MKGNENLLTVLNSLLPDELTVINQCLSVPSKSFSTRFFNTN